jgi:hypothetical protein
MTSLAIVRNIRGSHQLLTNTFVVRPDIFIAYPINRAFVEGRAKHPPLLEYWSVSVVSLLVSLALLAVGLGIIPISFGEEMAFMRWALLFGGVASLIVDIYLINMTLRLRNGRLIEGRVVEADIRPHHSRPNRKMQHILVEYRDPAGQMQVLLHIRSNLANRPLPEVGTQAAVLYVSPNMRRLL